MKNIFKYNFLFAAATIGLLSSCSEDDDKTLVSGFKPTITVDQSSFSVTEGDEITINLLSSQAINKSMEFKVELIGGTASFRDYTSSGTETVEDDGQGIIGHRFAIPAFTTDYSFTVTPVIDLLPEGAETIKLRVYAMGNANGALDKEITINVADYVSNDLALELDWAQSAPNRHGNIHEGEYTDVDGDAALYSDYDFDLYLEDADGNDVTGYAGASSNSPEMCVLDAALPDGDYYVYVDLWTAGPTPEERFQHDIKINVAKYGQFFTTYPITTFSDEVFSDYVLQITKTGNSYVVADYNTSEVIISGRVAAMKERIKNRKLNKRK